MFGPWDGGSRCHAGGGDRGGTAGIFVAMRFVMCGRGKIGYNGWIFKGKRLQGGRAIGYDGWMFEGSRLQGQR